jgi:hypothetical protein
MPAGEAITVGAEGFGVIRLKAFLTYGTPLLVILIGVALAAPRWSWFGFSVFVGIGVAGGLGGSTFSIWNYCTPAIALGPHGVTVRVGSSRQALWQWSQISSPGVGLFARMWGMAELPYQPGRYVTDEVYLTRGQLLAVLGSPYRPQWELPDSVTRSTPPP